MGRKRTFVFGELPRGVASVAVAVIADYNRRVAALERGELSCELTRAYRRYQAIVDEALLSIEAGYRAEFISDIAAGRGWDSSYLSRVYSKAAYYSRRRAVVYAVAKGLRFVE